MRSAFEKHKNLLRSRKTVSCNKYPKYADKLHNYSLDSEEEIFDARRAALSRITAAARANGLAIAREFQKLKKAYNRGYNAMYADESSYMFCEDNIEDDEDYGPRRKRKRAAGKNINSYDSDTARDENSGRKFMTMKIYNLVAGCMAIPPGNDSPNSVPSPILWQQVTSDIFIK